MFPVVLLNHDDMHINHQPGRLYDQGHVVMDPTEAAHWLGLASAKYWRRMRAECEDGVCLCEGGCMHYLLLCPFRAHHMGQHLQSPSRGFEESPLRGRTTGRLHRYEE